MRIGGVGCPFEVLVAEAEDVLHVGIDVHLRQGARFARQLQMYLVEVVQVDVCVAQCMDEVARLQSRHLSHHHQQQGIRRDVERYSQKRVGAALVELQAEPSVGDIELEEQVAGRQVHAFQVSHVQGAPDDAALVRVMLDGLDRLLYLVDEAPVVVRPRTPLVAIDMPQLPVRVSPFVPDADAMLLEEVYVGVAAQEPQQFVDDGFQMELLGRQAGETVVEGESHLMAEHADGARPRAVLLAFPLGEDTVE